MPRSEPVPRAALDAAYAYAQANNCPPIAWCWMTLHLLFTHPGKGDPKP